MSNSQEPVTKELFDFAIGEIRASVNRIEQKIDDTHKIDNRVIAHAAIIKEHGARLGRVEGNLAKLAWTVIGAIVAGMMNFMLNGGFKR